MAHIFRASKVHRPDKLEVATMNKEIPMGNLIHPYIPNITPVSPLRKGTPNVGKPYTSCV